MELVIEFKGSKKTGGYYLKNQIQIKRKVKRYN